MKQNWPTKDKDMETARMIMQEYSSDRDSSHLGLMEVVVNTQKKRMDLRLSGWVVLLAKHFNSEYGASHGDFVTRQVISRCITKDATMH